ncbi:MAG: SIMPL domain-containing protein [Holosporales bacterium]|jgi:hypothetical protein|nr:SIMPL domain-containing protein [Holosporales bacterium]
MKEKGLVSQSGVFFNFFLGLGIALSGLFIGKSLEQTVHHLKRDSAYVKVKGLAERKVKSDEGKLRIIFDLAGNDIEELIKCATENLDALRKFVAENGIQSTECFEHAIKILDTHADFVPTKHTPTPPLHRYRVNWRFLITSNDVDKIDVIHQRLNDFSIKQTMKNKDLSPVYTIPLPEYEFTKLEQIRAEIIAEATQSARKAADQFAIDSKCRVGAIQHADQGSIAISASSMDKVKRLRLVTYVAFNLVN